jgi:hypothetical protein
MRIRSLEGTPNYGPRQLYKVMYNLEILDLFFKLYKGMYNLETLYQFSSIRDS